MAYNKSNVTINSNNNIDNNNNNNDDFESPPLAGSNLDYQCSLCINQHKKCSEEIKRLKEKLMEKEVEKLELKNKLMSHTSTVLTNFFEYCQDQNNLVNEKDAIIQQLEKEKVELNERIKQLEEHHKTQKLQIETLQGEKDQLVTNVGQLQKDNKELITTIGRLEYRIEQQNTKIKTQSGQLKTQSDQLKTQGDDITELKEQMKALMAHNRSLNENIDRDRINALQDAALIGEQVNLVTVCQYYLEHYLLKEINDDKEEEEKISWDSFKANYTKNKEAKKLAKGVELEKILELCRDRNTFVHVKDKEEIKDIINNIKVVYSALPTPDAKFRPYKKSLLRICRDIIDDEEFDLN